MTRLHQPDLTAATVLADSDASEARHVPPLGLAGTLLEVLPHEVEVGDYFLGCNVPVASILQTDGKLWIYAGGDGVCIARRPHWTTVTVRRPISSVVDPRPDDSGGEARLASAAMPLTAASSDDCPPHGIQRTRSGLKAVLP